MDVQTDYRSWSDGEYDFATDDVLLWRDVGAVEDSFENARRRRRARITWRREGRTSIAERMADTASFRNFGFAEKRDDPR